MISRSRVVHVNYQTIICSLYPLYLVTMLLNYESLQIVKYLHANIVLCIDSIDEFARRNVRELGLSTTANVAAKTDRNLITFEVFSK